jgi:hypothetical protein
MSRTGEFIEEYRGKKIMLTEDGYTAPGYLVHKTTVKKMREEIDADFAEEAAMMGIERTQKDILRNPDSYYEQDDPARYR